MMKVSEFTGKLSSTLIGSAKLMLLSRKVRVPRKSSKGGSRVVVLGNGPSLRKTIAESAPLLRAMPTIAVNFMANAPEFSQIRPDFYVLADPHFFTGLQHDNVRSLWETLARVDWPMTLCVPATRLATVKKLVGTANSCLTLSTFNFFGVDGFDWFENMAYSRSLAMPRPRNVLIPAIMTAIAAGYAEIDIVGADHSWMETIRVTEANHVVSVQPHFYADSQKELKRSEQEYRGVHLHDILMSFYIAFRSYHRIARYAHAHGIEIYNATPGSYIDAFPRRPLIADRG